MKSSPMRKTIQLTIASSVLPTTGKGFRALCTACLLGMAAHTCAYASQSPAAAAAARSQALPVGSSQTLKPSPAVPAAAPAKAPEAASSLDQAPNMASVTLRDGKLTIDTNNSDLGQILKDFSQISGMKIDGAVASSRVFGVYGPGDPADVLTSLLSGSGYSFMMVGGLKNGAPRELTLAAQNKGGSQPANAQPATRQDDNDDNGSDDEQGGPGAIVHSPPFSEDPRERMQQNMQRLQQMHDEQQQQQEQNQNQNPPPQ